MADAKLQGIVYSFLIMVAVAVVIGSVLYDMDSQTVYSNGTRVYYHVQDNFTSRFENYVDDSSSYAKNIYDQMEEEAPTDENQEDKYGRSALLTVSAYKEIIPMIFEIRNTVEESLHIPPIFFDVLTIFIIIFIAFGVIFILWTRNKA